MARQDHRNTPLNNFEEIIDATKEQQIAWLCQIINSEVEKSDDEVDYDLVMECTEFLKDLTSADMPYSNEEIEEKFKKIEGDIAQAEQRGQILSAPTHKKRFKPWLKIVVALAATFSVFFATLTVVAKTQGYSSAWEFVATNARKLIGLESGEQFDENGITVIKHTGKTFYTSIDELMEKEAFGILYPSNLPDDLKIKEIQQFYESTDEYSLVFLFSEQNDRIHVSNNEKIDFEKIENTEAVSIGGIEFYITQMENGIYHATGWHNGFKYNFQSMEYEKIMIMLNCLKGY